MLFYSTIATNALAAIAFFSQALLLATGHARGIGHQYSYFKGDHKQWDVLAKRASAENVEVPLGQLQLLQSEYTTFKLWMTALNASSIDAADLVAQLKQQIEAYDDWMTAWLESAFSAAPPLTTPSPPPSLPPSPSPSLPPPPGTLLTSAITVQPTVTASLSWSSSAEVASIVASNTDIVYSAVSFPGTGGVHSSGQSTNTGGPVLAQVLSSSMPNAPNTVTSSLLTVVSSSIPAFSTSTTASSALSGLPTAGASRGSHSFDITSSKNVGVYYGQSSATSQVPLTQICSDSDVDIVILAFLTTFSGPGGYPTLNFGSACDSAGEAATAKGATGLLTCPDLAKSIQACQSTGKAVLLSLGGSEAVTAFSSDDQARSFAIQLWNLFGAGTGESVDLRPFGEVKIDGFDVDNEDHSTAHYATFVSTLRSTIDTDPSKKYYISAAPQCPRPDVSIPLDAMQSMDLVWVQFYNNGECDIGQTGFLDSFKGWSSDLNRNGLGPKLYIGAPACAKCAGQGYIDASTMDSVVRSAQSAGVDNFGGVMLWDGAEAVENPSGDYLKTVKGALG